MKDLNSKLKEAIKRVKEAEGVSIDGKSYTTVAERLLILREVFGFDLKIQNIQKFYDGTECQFECRIYFKDGDEWTGIANGFSCERRNANETNLQSVVEVAETSAVGRALGFLGLGGGSISSAEEVKEAKSKKGKVTKHTKSSEKKEKLIKQIEFLTDELNHDINSILKTYKVSKLEELNEKQLKDTMKILNAGTEQDII